MRAIVLDLTLGRGNFRRIARDANLTYQFVARVLKGETGLSWKSAIRIADAAGVSLDQLREYLDSVKDKKAA